VLAGWVRVSWVVNFDAAESSDEVVRWCPRVVIKLHSLTLDGNPQQMPRLVRLLF